MPSELKDLQGLSSSSSFLGHSTSFPNERQVGFWKQEGTSNSEGRGNSFASSPLEKYLTVEQQMGKPLERPDSYLIQNQNENTNFHTSRAEVEASQPLTLLRPVDQDPVQSTFYFAQGKKNSMLGAQYENSLFSSSLSELFCRKLRLSSNNGFDGHSINTVASHYEEEPLESLEELEAQTIGDLLPKDDDLLSGLTHDLEHIAQPANTDDAEEIDLFNSVGGMDLGDDSSTTQKVSSELPGGIVPEQWMIYKNSIAGEHPYGEHPSRTLFVRNINSNVEDSELKALFEQYGDIRQLYTACKHRGFVMIAYFDIRSARNAMKALQNKPLRRRKLDIHYSIPKDNPSEKDVNQGTLAVFNLDSSVSNEKLYEIFGRYGEIKEIRETPHRSNQKFVEYYDVRAADAALRALNRCEIAGKRIKLEPSRPGGTRRLVQQLASGLDQDGTGHFPQQSSPPYESTTGFSGSLPLLGSISNGMDNGNILGVNSAVRAPVSSLRESGIHHGVSSSVSNGLQSLLRVDSVGNQSGLAESNQSQGHLKLNIASAFHPHSLPEYIDCLTDSSSPGMMSRNINPRQERIDNRQMSGVNGHADLNGSVFGSANGGQSIPGHPITWSNSYNPQPPGMMWQNSPSASLVSGIGSPHPPQQLHGIPRAPSSMLNPVLPVNNHHVGSAPTVNPLWDMRHTYVGESPEASGFHPGSLGSMRMSNNPLHSMEFVSRNIFPNVGANSMEIPHKNIGFQSPQQKFMMYPGRGQMLPMMNSFDPSSERARSRRNEGCSNQADKKHFELDLERIMRGEDNRTTLMIKNIPNKYTSKMLLAAIDDRHKGTYDFIYLPIDFKNKCNVGYAFINMTDPKHIVPFYKTFNGKKWEKFNSEKVASLAYARIQGKAALIAHFQNSSLMNEDKRCRPILFNTEGPNAGDQVPFPMGPNVRSRPGKSRINTNEEFHQDSAASAAKEENFVKGDVSSGSVKESD